MPPQIGEGGVVVQPQRCTTIPDRFSDHGAAFERVVELFDPLSETQDERDLAGENLPTIGPVSSAPAGWSTGSARLHRLVMDTGRFGYLPDVTSVASAR